MIADLSFRVLRSYSTAWMRSRCRVLLRGTEYLPAGPGGRRVYMIINHSTTYDLVALMHISANRFNVIMDSGAFHFPVVRHIFHGAQFIPLMKTDSNAAIQRAVESVRSGLPLLMSLTDGGYTMGQEERPRTGGVRIAHLAAADIHPVFTMAEEDRVRMRSFKGRDGNAYPYTTFRDSLYVIAFLPPIPASHFGPAETYESYQATARELGDMAEREKKHFTEVMREERSRLSGRRVRGGSSRRVAW